MAEELPYIPNEIVNIIAHFTEGSAGLAFSRTSRIYYYALYHNKITYLKQFQLDQINKNKTVIVDGKQYYGSATGFYCYDCSCFLIKTESKKKHHMRCHKRVPLICDDCGSPHKYHKTFTGICAFSKVRCGQCDRLYLNYIHNSRICPRREVYCKSCSRRYLLVCLEQNDKESFICKCNSILTNYW